MLPLAQRRILVTRPRGQASALAAQLAALGAEAIQIPAIELAPPASYRALDAALTALRSFDWVVFTSANAVLAFAERARQLQLQVHPRRIAVIGPATAAAVQAGGVHADEPALLMPRRYVAEALLESLLPHAAGAGMLLPRAAAARDLLPQGLAAAGALVTLAETYRTVVPPDSVERLRTLFATRPPDAITFTSASTAQNLQALLAASDFTIPPATVLASIGPVTSQAMREAGLQPTIEAARSTIPGLVEALCEHLAG